MYIRIYIYYIYIHKNSFRNPKSPAIFRLLVFSLIDPSATSPKAPELTKAQTEGKKRVATLTERRFPARAARSENLSWKHQVSF